MKNSGKRLTDFQFTAPGGRLIVNEQRIILLSRFTHSFCVLVLKLRTHKHSSFTIITMFAGRDSDDKNHQHLLL